MVGVLQFQGGNLNSSDLAVVGDGVIKNNSYINLKCAEYPHEVRRTSTEGTPDAITTALSNATKYMFLTDTDAYIQKVEESRHLNTMKNLITNRTLGWEPKYFITCFYGRSVDGGFLTPDAYRKRWDRGQVRHTHRIIRGHIHKCFGSVPMFWTIERHDSKEHPVWGEMKGSFHSHLYLGEIDDAAIDDPTKYLKALYFKKDYFGYSINSNRVNGSNLKTELLDACIRQSKWVGLFPDSLDIKIIKRDGRMPTVHYGLKQIKEEDDLNNGIDWDNSDLKNKRRSKTNEKFLLV